MCFCYGQNGCQIPCALPAVLECFYGEKLEIKKAIHGIKSPDDCPANFDVTDSKLGYFCDETIVATKVLQEK